jgi:hypothetical protein
MYIGAYILLANVRGVKSFRPAELISTTVSITVFHDLPCDRDLFGLLNLFSFAVFKSDVIILAVEG